MAGWILRVVTVTYGPRYLRLPSYVPPRNVDTRRPSEDEVHLQADLPTRVRGVSGGPCGSCARAPAGGLVWTRLISELNDYVDRWGSNPLGASHRLGNGAKLGKRGRGSQDYLFTHR